MPITIDFQAEKPLLMVTFSGVVTREDMAQYMRERPNAAPKDLPMIVWADMLEVEEWDTGVKPDNVEDYVRGMSKLLEDAETVIAKIMTSTSEEVYGYARMLQTYVDQRYPVHMFDNRKEAEACVQRYLDGE